MVKSPRKTHKCERQGRRTRDEAGVQGGAASPQSTEPDMGSPRPQDRSLSQRPPGAPRACVRARGSNAGAAPSSAAAHTPGQAEPPLGPGPCLRQPVWGQGPGGPVCPSGMRPPLLLSPHCLTLPRPHRQLSPQGDLLPAPSLCQVRPCIQVRIEPKAEPRALGQRGSYGDRACPGHRAR